MVHLREDEDVGILEKLVRDREGHPEEQEENQGHDFNGTKEEENSKKIKRSTESM